MGLHALVSFVSRPGRLVHKIKRAKRLWLRPVTFRVFAVRTQTHPGVSSYLRTHNVLRSFANVHRTCLQSLRMYLVENNASIYTIQTEYAYRYKMYVYTSRHRYCPQSAKKTKFGRRVSNTALRNAAKGHSKCECEWGDGEPCARVELMRLSGWCVGVWVYSVK